MGELLALIERAGNAGIAVSELAKRTRTKPGPLSQRLMVLLEGGMVEYRQVGRGNAPHHFYRLTTGALGLLLTLDDPTGYPGLPRPLAYLERLLLLPGWSLSWARAVREPMSTTAFITVVGLGERERQATDVDTGGWRTDRTRNPRNPRITVPPVLGELARAGRDGVTTAAIAEALGMKEGAVKKVLGVLRTAVLIDRHRPDDAELDRRRPNRLTADGESLVSVITDPTILRGRVEKAVEAELRDRTATLIGQQQSVSSQDWVHEAVALLAALKRAGALPLSPQDGPGDTPWPSRSMGALLKAVAENENGGLLQAELGRRAGLTPAHTSIRIRILLDLCLVTMAKSPTGAHWYALTPLGQALLAIATRTDPVHTLRDQARILLSQHGAAELWPTDMRTLLTRIGPDDLAGSPTQTSR